MLTLNKFTNPRITSKGEPRAYVQLAQLQTLWFNTGTLCNLECAHCYIESSPKNDRLVYLQPEDIRPYLQEIQEQDLKTQMIGLTGGEPFLNPSIIPILKLILAQGFDCLVLTNACRVLEKHKNELLKLRLQFGHSLKIRVSLDHYTAAVHEHERGEGTFQRTLEASAWLYQHHFDLSIAGRSLTHENLASAQKGYQEVLQNYAIHLDMNSKLVVFPEMSPATEIPEISVGCWEILHKKPEEQMCATERMIVKRRGESQCRVLPCTLLAYQKDFELGQSLKESAKKVYLNHRFCAQFCVLGGANCSSTH